MAEIRTPPERNDQDKSDPVAQPNPSVLASRVQETPAGIGFVAAGAEHDVIIDDVLLDEKNPSHIPPVDVTGKNVESVIALLGHDESEQFRTRWNEVQGKFVDDHRSAVQQADALVIAGLLMCNTWLMDANAWGLPTSITDEQMRLVRFREQGKAATIGEYAAQIILDHPSAVVKHPGTSVAVDDLVSILQSYTPQVVYTHNLEDKHDTHVGVALRTIATIRSLPASTRPTRLYGCEVWRGLDWLVDDDKVLFDLSAQQNIRSALVAIFDSQIGGGKRYDLAFESRNRANATYYKSHSVDAAISLSFAMDMTPLIQDDSKEPLDFIREILWHFTNDVVTRLSQFC